MLVINLLPGSRTHKQWPQHDSNLYIHTVCRRRQCPGKHRHGWCPDSSPSNHIHTRIFTTVVGASTHISKACGKDIIMHAWLSGSGHQRIGSDFSRVRCGALQLSSQFVFHFSMLPMLFESHFKSSFGNCKRYQLN